MAYNWQQNDWTIFDYDKDEFEEIALHFQEIAGQSMGYLKGLSLANAVLKTADTPTELIFSRTEQLNEMLEISSKSIENQRKLRSDFLKGFEFKLSQIYHISTPIERISSKTDKRMFGYALNTVILEKIKLS
jgi:Domain of unknown function (DUF4172)